MERHEPGVHRTGTRFRGRWHENDCLLDGDHNGGCVVQECGVRVANGPVITSGVGRATRVWAEREAKHYDGAVAVRRKVKFSEWGEFE